MSAWENQTSLGAITFTPIGYVENRFERATPAAVMRAEAVKIILRPELTPGLDGLTAGERLLILFYFHLSAGFDLQQHPRGDVSRPTRGVFALRSPRRPNPIGATTVELLNIEGNILTVRGLDAFNGTPVLDMKPA